MRPTTSYANIPGWHVRPPTSAEHAEGRAAWGDWIIREYCEKCGYQANRERAVNHWIGYCCGTYMRPMAWPTTG